MRELLYSGYSWLVRWLLGPPESPVQVTATLRLLYVALELKTTRKGGAQSPRISPLPRFAPNGAWLHPKTDPQWSKHHHFGHPPNPIHTEGQALGTIAET